MVFLAVILAVTTPIRRVGRPDDDDVHNPSSFVKNPSASVKFGSGCLLCLAVAVATGCFFGNH